MYNYIWVHRMRSVNTDKNTQKKRLEANIPNHQRPFFSRGCRGLVFSASQALSPVLESKPIFTWRNANVKPSLEDVRSQSAASGPGAGTHLEWGRYWWECPPPCTAEQTASFQPQWTLWTSLWRILLVPRQTPSHPPLRAQHPETWTAPKLRLWYHWRESRGYFGPLIQIQDPHWQRRFF